MDFQELSKNDPTPEVKTKEDFIKFLGFLIQDWEKNREYWYNKDIKSYLEAMQSW